MLGIADIMCMTTTDTLLDTPAAVAAVLATVKRGSIHLDYGTGTIASGFRLQTTDLTGWDSGKPTEYRTYWVKFQYSCDTMDCIDAMDGCSFVGKLNPSL